MSDINNYNENEILSNLSNEEKKLLGLVDDSDLEELHNELGIVDQQEVNNNIENNTTEKQEPVKEEKIISQPIVKPKNEYENINDILKNIKVDLNNIELTEKPSLEVIEDINFIINGKPTYQVVCNQSCYVAHMQSIRLNDIYQILNSTSDYYSGRNQIYKLIYNKINTTSVGKPDYNTWLQMTSMGDVETLLFGIYNQSTPSETKFNIKCRNCNHSIAATINNDTLISVKNDDVFKNINEILSSYNKPEDIIKNSLINKSNRVILDNSKIIVDIRTPSLYQYLSILSSVKTNLSQEEKDKANSLANILVFIKDILIPDYQELKINHKLKYTEIDERSQIASIVSSFEMEDTNQLGNFIEERNSKYNIEYKIKNFNCSNCGKELGDIPVNMEELLFTQIL